MLLILVDRTVYIAFVYKVLEVVKIKKKAYEKFKYKKH